jgi:hypothetical protein
MTPQERDLITILLGRLNKIKGQPQDPEAETLVRETIAVRADTAYSLVQTVLIQDLSLHNAQNRIIDLETQLTEMKRAASAPPSFLGSPSFLGAVFGSAEPSGGVRTAKLPGDPGTGQRPLATKPGYGPEGSSAAAPAPGAGLIGGGFLQSAATTAAGITGGALLLEGIRSILGHQDSLSINGKQPVAPNLGGTVLRNRYGAEAGASGGGSTDEHVGADDDPSI